MFKITGCVVAVLGMALLPIGNASALQVVYQTDFSEDPGWTTNNSSHCYWDSSDGTFCADLSGGEYAYYYLGPINSSFQLDWDFCVISSDHPGGGIVGLFDCFPVPGGDNALYVLSGGGSHLSLSYGSWDISHSYGRPYISLNTWYSVHASYDAATRTLGISGGASAVFAGSWGIGDLAKDYPRVKSPLAYIGIYEHIGTNCRVKIDNVVFMADQNGGEAPPEPCEPPILPKEAELAIQVIGAPYLGDGSSWGGKGYDCCASQFVSPDNLKTSGYSYYDGRINRCNVAKATGVDCSGLIFWAYNRAYYGDQVLTGQDLRNLPVLYEGAGGQYRYNTDRISKEELKAGDLLFFEGHVAMYTGPFSYEGEEYNVVHASGFTWTIAAASYDPNTEEVITVRPTGERQLLKVKDYGRVTQPRKQGEIIAKSPVDLGVKDPDGLILERQIREVPGMEYQVCDIDGDGDLDDIVIIGERKIGDYLIVVVPESGAPPTDTYTLEFTVGGETIVLAENLPISEIPEQAYLVESTDTTANAAPIGDAGGPYEGVPGKPVTFDASGSYDPDGQIVLAEWDWDLDGTYDYQTSNAVCQHIWNSPFSGTIRLRVTDNDGLTSFDMADVTITAPVPQSVDDLVGISCGRVAYDRRTGQFSVDVKVTNNSQTVIGSPVWLVIETISNPAVTLAGSDGTTIDGNPYVDVSGLLGNGQLDPAETISKRIYFNNPNRVQFTFKPSVRGVILP